MIDKIEILISEYFQMEVGENIENYQDFLEFSNGEIYLKLKRKVLKHIVEKRKADNYGEQKILQLFEDLQNILKSKFYKIIPNTNQDINSLLLIEDSDFENKEEGMVVALEIIKYNENSFYIKTGFYRSIAKIKKLLQQK